MCCALHDALTNRIPNTQSPAPPGRFVHITGLVLKCAAGTYNIGTALKMAAGAGTSAGHGHDDRAGSEYDIPSHRDSQGMQCSEEEEGLSAIGGDWPEMGWLEGQEGQGLAPESRQSLRQVSDSTNRREREGTGHSGSCTGTGGQTQVSPGTRECTVTGSPPGSSSNVHSPAAAKSRIKEAGKPSINDEGGQSRVTSTGQGTGAAKGKKDREAGQGQGLVVSLVVGIKYDDIEQLVVIDCAAGDGKICAVCRVLRDVLTPPSSSTTAVITIPLDLTFLIKHSRLLHICVYYTESVLASPSGGARGGAGAGAGAGVSSTHIARTNTTPILSQSLMVAHDWGGVANFVTFEETFLKVNDVSCLCIAVCCVLTSLSISF